MPVYLAQMLCPQRHCILAAASEESTPEALRRQLRQAVAVMLRGQLLNPWCGLCGALEPGWCTEVSRTRFATMDEAAPALRAMEREQIRDGQTLRRLGLAYDPPETPETGP